MGVEGVDSTLPKVLEVSGMLPDVTEMVGWCDKGIHGAIQLCQTVSELSICSVFIMHRILGLTAKDYIISGLPNTCYSKIMLYGTHNPYMSASSMT